MKRRLLPKLQAQFEEGVDIVLDYLWARPPSCFCARCQIADQVVMVYRSDLCRSYIDGSLVKPRWFAVDGSGLGSVPMPRLLAGIGDFFRIIEPAGLHVDFVERPLRNVGEAWQQEGVGRIVLTMEGLR